MKKVSRKKEAPPLPNGGAKDCATDQEARRKYRAANGGGQARPREAVTLKEAVEAQEGVTVQVGRDRDADGITFGAPGVGVVLLNLPYWRTEFGEPGKDALNTMLSALVVLIGCVIGRTARDEAAMEARLDRLREYLTAWALAGFNEAAN
jgi:hypothetical protein